MGDRLRRHPIMLWTDFGRAALLACIPAAWALGALRFEHLLIVALLVGGQTVFFDAAYQAIVPVLVSRGRFVEADSKLETSGALTSPRPAWPACSSKPSRARWRCCSMRSRSSGRH